MRKHRSIWQFALLAAIICLVYVSCRKMNDVQSNHTETVAQKENRFFNEHSSNDPAVQALAVFIKRKNEEDPFIAKTVERIGYPYWDKALSLQSPLQTTVVNKINSTNKKETGYSGDGPTATTVYIPFVRDEDKQVNAALIFTTTPTDTSFSYVCDWQYKHKEHGSADIPGTAENHALFFMMMDKRTLGHRTFNILDGSLFPKAGLATNPKKVSFITRDTAQTYKPLYYVGFCEESYVCRTPDNSACQPFCDWMNCPTGECSRENICTVSWINPWNGGGGSSGGSGGSGGGGGNSGGGGNNNEPPDCEDPANKHHPDCEEGWEPAEPPTITEPVDTVYNNLVNICMDSAFKKITADTIKAALKKLFTNTFVIPGNVFSVVIKDAANLTHQGDTVPAYTVVSPDNTQWEISLNNTFFNRPGYNISQEGWGQIIIHEILHTFIGIHLPQIRQSGLDHLSIFQNFTTLSKQLLMETFGMDSSLALRLALSGIRDNWGFTNFDSISIATYGVGLTSIDSTYDAYTKGGLGRKCN